LRGLSENDETLKEMKRAEPADTDMFVEMTSFCVMAIITMLERQSKRYFDINITEELRRERLSAR